MAASLSDAKGVFAEGNSRIRSFIHSLTHQTFIECPLCAVPCARCQGYTDGEINPATEHFQSRMQTDKQADSHNPPLTGRWWKAQAAGECRPGGVAPDR